MTGRLRVAILGAGGIGARHAQAIAALPETMTLTACCGRSAESAEAFAARFKSRSYVDFERMLGEEQLDLLIVALPPFAHAGQVEKAASAGVNLLVEKPIALDMARARSMVAAAETAGVTAACGFMYRFGAAVTAWDDACAAGQTGAPAQFSGQFHSNALHAQWWRERARSGGQMVEQLIHIVDLARHMLGKPQSVFARAENLFHRDVAGYDSEDISAMILVYEDGRLGVLHASNAAVPGRWAKQWQMISHDMTAIFSGWNNAEFVRTGGEPANQRIDSDRDVFVAQLADVADAIRRKRPPRVPLTQGADTLEIVLAARRSADEGREVAL